MEIITRPQAFLQEFFGAVILILLGNGVRATISLRTTRVADAGRLGIAFGQGLAVLAGASIVDVSGGRLNPVVTVALVFDGTTGWNLVPYYATGQLLDAFADVTPTWAAFKQLFDANGVDDNGSPTNVNAETGGSFFTASLHPNNFWNAVTELLVTFVLLSLILFGPIGGELGPLKYLGVSLIIVLIGLSLGPPIGYAISPVRDLGPRLTHAFVPPTKGKSDANRFHTWIPIATPMLVAVATGALTPAV